MNFLSFPQQSAMLTRVFSPSCGAACLLLSLFLEASSLALTIYLHKLETTSENEEIEAATSTPGGQKLLKAKCYRGI